jgi:hypothetical protein
MSGNPDDIYDDDGTDPLGDLDEEAPRKGEKRKARAKEWIGCPYPWWLWVSQKTTSKQQLHVALELYRRCCQLKMGTITLPTSAVPGMDRHHKAEALRALARVGVVKIRNQKGRPSLITLKRWRGR